MMRAANDNGLTFLSVCSGIEAASVAWKELNWRALAFSEIEKFPSAVLAYHYPDVPNLGDMTKFKDWPDFEIDILCGGTPCQAFSVAGLREGLNDPRGNLTLTFLGIAKKYEPQFIVWENVPGIFSDKTGALVSFLTGLEELGYVVDVDVADAQYFGLAQRRRRVVVCGQHIKYILNQRTISSALTLAQCLSETSRHTLAVLTTPSTNGPADSASSASNALNSLQRKMKLFGLQQGEQASTSVENLAAVLASLGCVRSDLASGVGLSSVAVTKTFVDTKQPTLKAAKAYQPSASQSTETQWQTILAAPLQTMSECITSTSSKATIDSKIYSCALLTLCITERMHQSMDSSPVFWSAAQSSLTALKEFTNYARQTSSDLFGDMAWLRAWRDFIEQADAVIEAVGNLRIESFGEVLPVSESLQWYSAPSREAGKDVAPTISARTKGGGGLGTDFDLDGGLVESAWPVDVAPTLNAHFGEKMGLENQHINGGAGMFVPAPVCVTGEVTHSLTAEGHDASEDGSGRGAPIVCFSAGDCGNDMGFDISPTLRKGGDGGGNQPAICFTAQDYGADAQEELSQTLRSGNHSGSHANGGVMPAVAITSAVRRLTPTECERLQGFPDGYTDIPWRGKPTSPDGPRYKALGNSWAVPKFTWLGRRIAALMPKLDEIEMRDAA